MDSISFVDLRHIERAVSSLATSSALTVSAAGVRAQAERLNSPYASHARVAYEPSATVRGVTVADNGRYALAIIVRQSWEDAVATETLHTLLAPSRCRGWEDEYVLRRCTVPARLVRPLWERLRALHMADGDAPATVEVAYNLLRALRFEAGRPVFAPPLPAADDHRPCEACHHPVAGHRVRYARGELGCTEPRCGCTHPRADGVDLAEPVLAID